MSIYFLILHLVCYTCLKRLFCSIIDSSVHLPHNNICNIMDAFQSRCVGIRINSDALILVSSLFTMFRKAKVVFALGSVKCLYTRRVISGEHVLSTM